MAEGNSEAKRLRGVTIMWLLVGVINGVLLALLLRDSPASAGWAIRVGLTATVAALAFGVAANFARRRQRVLEARPDGERA